MSVVEMTISEESGIPGDLAPVALRLRAGLTYEEWQGAGNYLSLLGRAFPFYVGDWLKYGNNNFGEDYASAPMIDVLVAMYSSETVRGWKYTCERIEEPRRRENLTMSHHREVAPLTPALQDELLALAEREGWKRDPLREEIGRRGLRERRATNRAPAHNGAASTNGSAVEVIPPKRSVGLIKRADLERRPDPQAFEAEFDQRPSFTVTRPDIEPPSGPVLPPRSTGRATDEAATYLHGMTRHYSSPVLKQHIRAILDEREGLLQLAQAAARAVEVGQITPELQAAAGG